MVAAASAGARPGAAVVDDVCATSERVGRGEIDRWLPEELLRLHNQFERVHPFIDGNGRTGRLVMNLVLVRLGYSPVIIFKRQRSAYLTAMQRADGGGIWRSPCRAVDAYRVARHQRRTGVIRHPPNKCTAPLLLVAAREGLELRRGAADGLCSS